MSKVAILLEDYYQVLEVWYPYLRLREDGIKPLFVGTGKGNYKSKEGYPAREDIAIDNVERGDFSGVIVPGGYAPDILRRYPKVNEFVKVMDGEGKLVASICHGGWVLVSSGILKGRTLTGFFAIKDDLIGAGAEYVDKEVVVDKNLITSRNPYDLTAFCTEIVKFLKEARK
ncbi:MAG: DJ-1/PfpI/YhbO family deglycase/protease [Candidatus Omnitrophica bacterium]|nr:DJ-1/PfpI/YhbO family deglycase/protease [Candidatus Omnitrophota bacterium]MBD3269490.1 DJ-1/PfpI/YhbO family deglycase/protease [Candidatus Omnitrophota bacterium]